MPTRQTTHGVGIPLNRNDPLVRAFLAYAQLLARYHRHRVLHLERLGSLLRQGRRVILVGNHVLDVLDPLLFTAVLIDRYGRIPHFIGHENLVFRLPGLGELAKRYQMIPSRHMRAAAAALRASGLLMLYPGSGSEAARRSYREEPYRLLWEKRFGFLRLALRDDAEIVFVAAVGIDEMYYQSSLKIPAWLLRLFSAERYEGSRMQFGVLGPHFVPTLLPFPVQITHVVSKPLDLGDRSAARHSRAALAQLHRRVVAHCQALLDAAVAQRERDAPLLDRAVRAGERLLQRVGV
jgi:1-acyl-sn-glycerol-3-phosphate acyltransferase